MKFMMQIYQGEALEAWGRMSEDEQKAVTADWGAINSTPGVTPGLGLGMPGTAKTVRVLNGAAVTTDGPFAEAKEALGGYFVYETDDLESALALAARVPSVRFGGAVEVRPIVESW
jgi:hypothetical protein